jgi:hypothetical protein
VRGCWGAGRIIVVFEVVTMTNVHPKSVGTTATKLTASLAKDSPPDPPSDESHSHYVLELLLFVPFRGSSAGNDLFPITTINTAPSFDYFHPSVKSVSSINSKEHPSYLFL